MTKETDRCPNCHQQFYEHLDADACNRNNEINTVGRSLCYNCGKGCFEYSVQVIHPFHLDDINYSRCCHCGITGNVRIALHG